MNNNNTNDKGNLPSQDPILADDSISCNVKPSTTANNAAMPSMEQMSIPPSMAHMMTFGMPVFPLVNHCFGMPPLIPGGSPPSDCVAPDVSSNADAARSDPTISSVAADASWVGHPVTKIGNPAGGKQRSDGEVQMFLEGLSATSIPEADSKPSPDFNASSKEPNAEAHQQKAAKRKAEQQQPSATDDKKPRAKSASEESRTKPRMSELLRNELQTGEKEMKGKERAAAQRSQRQCESGCGNFCIEEFHCNKHPSLVQDAIKKFREEAERTFDKAETLAQDTGNVLRGRANHFTQEEMECNNLCDFLLLHKDGSDPCVSELNPHVSTDVKGKLDDCVHQKRHRHHMPRWESFEEVQEFSTPKNQWPNHVKTLEHGVDHCAVHRCRFFGEESHEHLETIRKCIKGEQLKLWRLRNPTFDPDVVGELGMVAVVRSKGVDRETVQFFAPHVDIFKSPVLFVQLKGLSHNFVAIPRKHMGKEGADFERRTCAHHKFLELKEKYPELSDQFDKWEQHVADKADQQTKAKEKDSILSGTEYDIRCIELKEGEFFGAIHSLLYLLLSSPFSHWSVFKVTCSSWLLERSCMPQ